jgi:hypothetical protein
MEHTINFKIDIKKEQKRAKDFIDKLNSGCQLLIDRETGKPFYCSKHGYDCEHVKKVNE